MSTDKVKRQIAIAKEKIRKAKEQIVRLEKLVAQIEDKNPKVGQLESQREAPCHTS
jgi:hypothetical protein